MADRRAAGDRVRRAYLWGVPWAGYLALLAVAREQAMPAILTGWILTLVWQIFALAALDAQIRPAERDPWRLLWTIAPACLLSTQSWDLAGLALANGLIELAIVEVSALLTALVVVMVLHDEQGKEMAWPGIIMLAGCAAGFLWAFGSAWLKLNPQAGWLRIGAVSGMFLLQAAVDWRWLRQVAESGLGGKDPFGGDRGPWLIIGQLVAWFLLPSVFALLHWCCAPGSP